MKTALINTNYWKEDKIFLLTPDVRYFYLCILTNPERNTTPAFRCSDRLLSAYTGFNSETIKLCRDKLIETSFIKFIDGYYIINDQDYIKASKGKLSNILFNKDYDKLPDNIKDLLMSHSGATQEYKDKENNTSINNTSKEAKLPKESPSSKELNTKKVNEIFNIFKEMNIELPKVYYQNKTQRNSALELYDSKGVEKVRNALEYYQDLKEKGVNYLITIYSPYDLLVKYEKLKDFKEEKK